MVNPEESKIYGLIPSPSTPGSQTPGENAHIDDHLVDASLLMESLELENTHVDDVLNQDLYDQSKAMDEEEYPHLILGFSEDIELARQLREQNERLRAELQYLEAIEQYLAYQRDNSPMGNMLDATLESYLGELLKYLDASWGDDLLISAHHCLKLCKLSIVWSSPTSWFVDRLIDETLANLLRHIKQLTKLEGLYRVAYTLHVKSNKDPIRLAFQDALGRVILASKNSSEYNGEHVRLMLIIFAWDLNEHFSDYRRTFEERDANLKNLRETAVSLEIASKILEDDFPSLRQVESSIHDVNAELNKFDCLRYPWEREQIILLVEPLASGCSVAGWYSEAETLFAVLRRASGSLIPNLTPSRIKVYVEYCLHLQRQRKWPELLSGLRCL